MIDFLIELWNARSDEQAIIWRDQIFTYGWLRDRFLYWKKELAEREVAAGTVVMLEADFSPNAVALFFALIDQRCVLVPLTASVRTRRDEFITIAQGEVSISVDDADAVSFDSLPRTATHSLYLQLKETSRPGLVLFSSGSTGESKAAVHDLIPLLEKFKVRRQSLRAISFLLYDHIGGVNTMLYTVSNGGCMITVQKRDPDGVLATVEKFQAQLLPTSPTFLNLVLLSEAYKRYDLGSLQIITYGTEPMPEYTLNRLHELFPSIKLQQTYGLSELGILRSKSKAPDSLWVKIGGEGFETRVVHGLLEVKAASSMLGYLNAPTPFTADDWFKTGDAVEVDGEYLKILGRVSEIINVGGEKVYPAEVENVIHELDSVAEVVVYGEKNPITGNIVCADVTPVQRVEPEAQKQLAGEIKKHCRDRLQRFKVPVKVNIVEETQHTERFKKARR